MEKVIFAFFVSLATPSCLFSQIDKSNIQRSPQESISFSFNCEEEDACNLIIYNGLCDWTTLPNPTSYSGGQELNVNDEIDLGAVTVANKNDTNGNGTPDYQEINVIATNIGRNEIDLMKLIIKKPIPDNGGNVKLTKIQGNIRLWISSTKGSEVILVGNAVEFPTNQLDKVIFIEAVDVSNSMRDIELKLEYQGNEDVVKATAVWVFKTTNNWLDRNGDQPVPGSSVLPNVGGVIKAAVKRDEASDHTFYGHGTLAKYPINKPEFQDPSWDDKKYGGRILMEWLVAPEGVESLISFDVTRQRSSKAWYNEYYSNLFIDSNDNTNFPFESNNGIFKDIEFPNDDSGGPKAEEDRIPINRYLYSWDPPNIWRNYPIEVLRAFVVYKSWFKEFVRVCIKSNPFTEKDDDLIGSRASPKFDWHCVFYARRDINSRLSKDFDLISYSNLKSQIINANDYLTINNFDPHSVTYEVGDFEIFYIGNIDYEEKEIQISKYYDSGYYSETFTIPLTSNSWNINFEGISFELKEINSIPPLTSIVFNTFKTGSISKENIINNGGYSNFLR